MTDRANAPMRILSVNAGGVQPLPLPGASHMQTGFYKTPVDGVVRVTESGLETDRRVTFASDNSRAVFLYQASYYDLWRRELGKALPYGTLGENLTFEGPENARFFLGDVLRIGNAHLRISQPRFPCRKLNARMGEGQDFARRYLQSGRLGFFCTVVEEGELSAGDTVDLIHRDDDPMSLDEFTRVTFLEQRNENGLKRLLASPSLSAAWKKKAARQLERLAEVTSGWRQYRPLTVTGKRQESSDVMSFELEDEAGDALPDYQAGQFLTIRLDVPNVERVTRTYTITGRSASGRGYAIAVKREAGDGTRPPGVVSNHLHDFVDVAGRIEALAPRGKFTLRPGVRPVVLLSAGIGITPMLAMLEQLVAHADDRVVIFAHGARCGTQHSFAERVRRLIGRSSRGQAFVTYSRPDADDVCEQDFDAVGRIRIADIEQRLGSLDADFYICGPAEFMRGMMWDLTDRGVDNDRIAYEAFGAAMLASPEASPSRAHPDGRPITVTFARSGVSVLWSGDDLSLLSLAEKQGIRPEASCRTGLCGTCAKRLDAGTVDYFTEPGEEPAEGDVLLCCTRPTTDVMLDL